MYLVLVFYCVLIALGSAFGGALPLFVRFTHRRIQFTLSFVSGVMLGVAMLHLLPHSISVLGRHNLAMVGCLAGLLVMFFLIRMFDFHHHDWSDGVAEGEGACDGHGHGHSHGGHHHQPLVKLSDADEASVAPLAPAVNASHLSWVGLSIGLAVHTLLDGVALSAAYQVERSHGWLPGLGTFLAIVLHKPLDAFSITSLMSARGWSVKRQTVVNLIFATMCPLGALLFAFSIDQASDWRDVCLGLALAFSAGVFLCISLGDLLPEVHFHSHDRGWLSVMLLLGVAIAVAIEFLPGHGH